MEFKETLKLNKILPWIQLKWKVIDFLEFKIRLTVNQFFSWKVNFFCLHGVPLEYIDRVGIPVGVELGWWCVPTGVPIGQW